jgi:hypothetical protein
MFIISFK